MKRSIGKIITSISGKKDSITSGTLSKKRRKAIGGNRLPKY
ncbi:MAG: hypothetical protein PHF33_01475 [Candidatus Delongbacteria bacterium]|nr:hypothetical protein [Candidatus Delongbacteria bacterium]